MRLVGNPIRKAKSAIDARADLTRVEAGLPSPDRQVDLFCRDHRGVYALPYPCRFADDAWRNAATGEPIEAEPFGWRVCG